MQRILDLDLDFFLHNVAHHKNPDGERLDSAHYPPWQHDEAVSFLERQCGLSRDDPLPGASVEHHGQVFFIWRELVSSGVLSTPFEIVHVDAHADLGMGDAGYIYLMSELMFREPPDRTNPPVGPRVLTDGNFLAFAAACRWVSALTYVHHENRVDDVFPYHMKDFSPASGALQLKAVEKSALRRHLFEDPHQAPVLHMDPPIPFTRIPWPSFITEKPFDFCFVSHSPAFTVPELDPLYEAILGHYICTI